MNKKSLTFFISAAMLVSGIGLALPGAAFADTVVSSSVATSSPASLIHSHPMSPIATFTTDLSLGSTGVNVMILQQYLNSKGYAVSLSGAGSAGQETQYFGPATQAALAKFQAASGIMPASGYYGPITRAYITQQLATTNGTGNDILHVIYQGEYTCLPHRDTTGVSTMECAFGLKTDGGLYYALDFTNDQAAAAGLQTGTRISVTGTYESNDQSAAAAQKYDIQGMVLVESASTL